MKRCLSILAFGLLLLTSCLNELQGDREEVTGPSNIVLNIATKPQTKLGAASDRDVMSNLHIWLVYGTKVEGYLCQNDADCNISGTGSTATATFENVPRGACTLYLVANLPVDSTLPTDYRVGGKAIDDDFLKYVLPAVDENTHEPPYGDTTPGMPLSTKLNMSVGAGTNRVSAELVRCCAKITLTIRNNTLNNTIILKDLAFTEFNPNTGYLFRQDDFSIPSSAYPFVPFRTLALQYGDTISDVIKHGETRTYIQQYMYETEDGGASSLGFEIKGGLFADGTTEAEVGDVLVSSTIVYKGGNSETKALPSSSSDLFLIKSYSLNRYMYDNNGTLSLSTETDESDILSKDNIDNYLWTFSGSTAITNYATGRTIRITNSAVSLESGTTVTSAGYTTNKGFRFYYSTYTNRKYYAYTLSYNSSTSQFRVLSTSNRNSPTPSTDNSCYWRLYKVTKENQNYYETNLIGASVYFDKTISSLNYINKYGTPVPLEQIYRNQDVQIVVNIHYNPNSGVLFFETCDWEGKDEKHETTFD